MIIVFWLFLLFSPILWIISFILLLIKRRPLTFLLNFVFCGVIIYLMWTGIDSGPQMAAAPESIMDDIGNTASSIVEGITKGFVSLVVAAGWGMSMLIYSMICRTAEKPELELLSDRMAGRYNSASSSAFSTSSPAPGIRANPIKRSNIIAYLLVGALVLYLLAKKAADMGL